MLLYISALYLGIVWCLSYYALRKYAHPQISKVAKIGILMGFWVTLAVLSILPLDIAFHLLKFGSPIEHQILKIAWIVIYFIGFFLCNFILPFLQEYEASYELSLIRKAKKSLRVNLAFYGLLGSIFGIFLFQILFSHHLPLSYAPSLIIALSNTYGLLVITICLGLGFSHLPQKFWNLYQLPLSLNKQYEKVESLHNQLVICEEDVEESIKASYQNIITANKQPVYDAYLLKLFSASEKAEEILKKSKRHFREQDLSYEKLQCLHRIKLCEQENSERTIMSIGINKIEIARIADNYRQLKLRTLRFQQIFYSWENQCLKCYHTLQVSNFLSGQQTYPPPLTCSKYFEFNSPDTITNDNVQTEVETHQPVEPFSLRNVMEKWALYRGETRRSLLYSRSSWVTHVQDGFRSLWYRYLNRAVLLVILNLFIVLSFVSLISETTMFTGVPYLSFYSSTVHLVSGVTFDVINPSHVLEISRNMTPESDVSNLLKTVHDFANPDYRNHNKFVSHLPSSKKFQKDEMKQNDRIACLDNESSTTQNKNCLSNALSNAPRSVSITRAAFTILWCHFLFLYITVSAYYMFFHLRLGSYHAVYPNQLTSGDSLTRSSSICCRLAAPLAYHFLRLLHFSGTSFESFYGQMNHIPVLGGHVFNTFFPLFVIIIFTISLCPMPIFIKRLLVFIDPTSSDPDYFVDSTLEGSKRGKAIFENWREHKCQSVERTGSVSSRNRFDSV